MIEIQNLYKSFNNKPVLHDLSLTIPDGETMVIVGESGCGKTVLLRSIIGLIKPDSGSIVVEDSVINRLRRSELFEIRKKFGMLFQSAALFDSMTVEENIALPLREHTNYSDSVIRNRIREKLNLVGLSGIEKKMPTELSGGMKKRVGLARALIMDPKYVLFDEPTTGLDPIRASAINELIVTTHRMLQVTSVVVTHDMRSAFTIADRIAMIKQGKVILTDTRKRFQNSDHPAVRQFISGQTDEHSNEPK
jgi:phospholipid/cholesterol/gamma-HCH transport system ATP-binding protein